MSLRKTKYYVSMAKEHLLSDVALAAANTAWLRENDHTIQGLSPVPDGYVHGMPGEQVWALMREQEATP